MYAKLGREAIDLFIEKGRKEVFYKVLGEVLYNGRRIEQLPVPPLHRQIAAMDEALLLTTNYDPLIELGMLRVARWS